MANPLGWIVSAAPLALRVRRRSSEHGLFTHAAAMAFFLLFSLPPMALIFVVLLSLLPMQSLIGDASLVETIQVQLHEHLPRKPAEVLGGIVEVYVEDSAAAVEGVFQRKPIRQAGVLFGGDDASPAARKLSALLHNGRPWLLLCGFLAILWSASGATRSTMDAMNAIHGVPCRSTTRQVVVSLLLTLGLVLCTALSIAVMTLGNLAASVIVEHRSLPVSLLVVWRGLNWIVGMLLLLLNFAVLQRYGPNVRLSQREVLVGGVVTVLLLRGTSVALRAYTEHGWDTYDATWGALASLVVLLMWCYCCAAAVLIGVEVNAERLERGLERERRPARRPRSRRRSGQRTRRRAA